MVKGSDPVVVESAIRGLEEQNLTLTHTYAQKVACEDAMDVTPTDNWEAWLEQSTERYVEPMQDVRIETEDTSSAHHDFKCREDGCHNTVCQLLDGFYVCQACGTMGDCYIESGAEWRSFGNEDTKVSDPSRCGNSQTSYLLPEQSNGTMISSKWRESDKMRHARQCHRWNSSHTRGRTLIHIFKELQQVAYKNGFSRMIVEDTKHLYKTTTDYHTFRGDNRKGLYAYCLFHTCKLHGVPRSIKEIVEMFDVDEQTLTKGHSAFLKVVKETETVDLRKRNKENTCAPDAEEQASTKKSKPAASRRRKTNKCRHGSKLDMMAKPGDYVERFCSRLKLHDSITQEVKSLVSLIRELGLSTDNPALIAAATIHMARRHAQIPSTTTQIQAVSNISHVTIDKCYKKLSDFTDVLYETMDATP